MKIAYYILLLSLATSCFLAACTKGGSGDATDNPDHQLDPNDTIKPVIEIYKPSNDQQFATGDTIRVEGKVTDNGLYRGSIKIINDANGIIIKQQDYEIHGLLLYNFNITQKTAVSVTTNYTVKVEFEDHGLNDVIKEVKIKVNP